MATKVSSFKLQCFTQFQKRVALFTLLFRTNLVWGCSDKQKETAFL